MGDRTEIDQGWFDALATPAAIRHEQTAPLASGSSPRLPRRAESSAAFRRRNTMRLRRTSTEKGMPVIERRPATIVEPGSAMTMVFLIGIGVAAAAGVISLAIWG